MSVSCPDAVFVCRNLPAKSAEETQRHRKQYEQMVTGAKRRGEFVLIYRTSHGGGGWA